MPDTQEGSRDTETYNICTVRKVFIMSTAGQHAEVIYRHAMAPLSTLLRDFHTQEIEDPQSLFQASLLDLEQQGEDDGKKSRRVIERTVSGWFTDLLSYTCLPFSRRKFRTRADVGDYIQNSFTVVTKALQDLGKQVVAFENTPKDARSLWWYHGERSNGLESDRVGEYLLSKDFFDLPDFLIHLVLILALPVRCTEDELEDDFDPLESIVTMGDYNVIDAVPIKHLFGDSELMKYLCAIGILTTADRVFDIDTPEACSVLKNGWNESSKVSLKDGKVVLDGPPVHIVYQALNHQKTTPGASYQACLVLSVLSQCGVNIHLPNEHLETALSFAARNNGILFTYLVAFGNRFGTKMRSNTADASTVHNSAPPSHAEFKALQHEVRDMKVRFSNILMMFTKLIDVDPKTKKERCPVRPKGKKIGPSRKVDNSKRPEKVVRGSPMRPATTVQIVENREKNITEDQRKYYADGDDEGEEGGSGEEPSAKTEDTRSAKAVPVTKVDRIVATKTIENQLAAGSNKSRSRTSYEENSGETGSKTKVKLTSKVDQAEPAPNEKNEGPIRLADDKEHVVALFAEPNGVMVAYADLDVTSSEEEQSDDESSEDHTRRLAEEYTHSQVPISDGSSLLLSDPTDDLIEKNISISSEENINIGVDEGSDHEVLPPQSDRVEILSETKKVSSSALSFDNLYGNDHSDLDSSSDDSD